VPALEPLPGRRAVAEPAALDGARWEGADVTELRIAPDEVLAIGALAAGIDDPHAIEVEERGFAGVWLTRAELARDVLPHIEWHVPADGPALVQGKVAGVPVKLWLQGAGGTRQREVLLLTHAAYGADLEERLGWR
jgi:hypothetical protein